MQEVEALSKLDVLLDDRHIQIENLADLNCLFSCTHRPYTLEVCIVKRENNRKFLGERIQWGRCSMVIIDMV